jgi:DNA repair exonuclease SbcCD ATPase subunit
LITGTNGAGKSTLLDALSFVLFGKPHRNIKNPQLINSVNGKNCEVEVEFTIGQDRYHIIRGYKPSIFEIYKNGQMLNQDSHSRDYQKILENNILKLNKKSFSQIVILGSGNFVPFMQMPLWDRRDVIEEVLDISVFSKMNSVLKEKMSKLKEEIRDSDQQITILKEKITLQKKHLNDLKQIGTEEIEEVKIQIEGLNRQIQDKQQELSSLDAEYDANHERIEKELAAAQLKMQRYDGFHEQISRNRDECQKNLKFYQENSSCPVCTKELDDDFKNEKIVTGRKRLEEFAMGLKKLGENRDAHKAVLKGTQDAAVEIKKVHMKSMTTLATLKGLQSQCTSLQDKLIKAAEKHDTTNAEKELAQNQDQLQKLSDLRFEQSNSRQYQEILLELLKDTGIKAKIIKQYIPLMNKCINQYLQTLDFFVSFTLDESFEETIRSRYRDDFSYASFSEGEKMRINLAILFTWRQIAKLKNHNNTNLLILDETMDSSLDTDGVDNLMKIISTLTATNIFIITHKPEIMSDKMEFRLEFEKNGLFSQLK